MKVLIIGGAGYFGAVTVRYLLSLGHEVTVIDDFRYNGDSLLDLCSNKRFDVIRSDIRDTGAVKSAILGNEVIVPFSAVVGKTLCDKYVYECYSINSETTEEIIRFVSNDQWLIYPSTQSCYGHTEAMQLCTENSELNPVSHYAKSKCIAERAVMQKNRYYICRFATLYGVSPRMRTDLLINNLVAQAVYNGYTLLNNASSYGNYLHVYDGARAIGHIIANLGDLETGVYNIGNQALNCTVEDICNRISDIIPDFRYVVDNSIECYDTRNYQVSIEKFYATGWRPSITLEDGINELAKAYTMLQIHRYVNY